MIDNNWSELIAKTGLSQNKIAEKIGVRRGEFSRACRGQVVLEAGTLADAAAVLGVIPADIYGKHTLETLYQFDMMLLGDTEEEARREVPATANIRISGIAAMKLDALVGRGKFKSRNRACDEIILQYKP